MFIKINKSIKLIGLMSLMIIIAFLSSCRLYSNINFSVKSERRDHFEEIGNEIIRCIKEKDRANLSNLFCEKVRNTDYLNRQIDFFFNFVDMQGGVSIDAAGNWDDGGGHSAYSGGRRVLELQGGNYDKKVLIGNKEYDLQFIMYHVLIGHKEYEGLTHIILTDERDLSDASLEKINIAKNDRTPSQYLGIRIYNFNYDIYKYENVAPKEIYESEEYRFSFDELEKGHSKW